MKLGTILLKLRKERKLTQSEIADRLDIGQSTYCAWESDRSLPNAKYYVNLAEIFGVSLTALTSQEFSCAPLNNSALQLNKQEIQVPYEDLILTQKQLIIMLDQKIDYLEKENQQLRQRIQTME